MDLWIARWIGVNLFCHRATKFLDRIMNVGGGGHQQMFNARKINKELPRKDKTVKTT